MFDNTLPGKLNWGTFALQSRDQTMASPQRMGAAEGLACRYLHEDIRTAEYGAGYGLAMLLYGEFNVFCPADARAILHKAEAALAEGGKLLLEPHTAAAVRAMGERGARWYTASQGLFSAQPYLCLEESSWDEASRAVTRRHFIVDAASAAVQRYAASYQCYSDDEYRAILRDSGLAEVQFYPSLSGVDDGYQRDFWAIVAHKPGELKKEHDR
jgi:hypothetical protein